MILTNWESIDSWCRASVTPNIASICCSSVAVALSVSVNFLSRHFRPGRKSRDRKFEEITGYVAFYFQEEEEEV